MREQEPHRCGCPNCQRSEAHPDQEIHRQMNLFLSRLNEDQRRWYIALEAKKLGRGGIKRLMRSPACTAIRFGVAPEN